MSFALSRNTLGAALAALLVVPPLAHAEVKLVGTGVVPGTATDNSGLTGLLEDGVTPRNLVGGFGSAIAYTGVGDLYVATPDRGPADGTTTYTDRAYLFRIPVRPGAGGQYSVRPRLLDTRLLKAEKGATFTGFAAAFDATNSPASRRLDPEGIRVANCGGGFYVSDEYGPFLYEFGPNGRRVRSIPLPTKLAIDLPSADPSVELGKNVFGRQANRGMEGLAISPDGTKLYGILQSPLIQDGGLDAALARVGKNVRIVEVDLKTGGFRELLYQLDSKSYGVSEILAVDDHRFLVLERDGKVGIEAVFKKIVLIDISKASDIRSIPSLPVTGTPAGVTPVSKTVLVDLVAQLNGPNASIPEKFEGLALGPDLQDGRHLLLVTVDNDFSTAKDSLIYAFAIDPADLPGYQPQAFGSCECREDHDHEREDGGSR
jgi:hypothetical protein